MCPWVEGRRRVRCVPDAMRYNNETRSDTARPSARVAYSTTEHTMHDNAAFGRCLKQRRQSLDLTQEELAQRAGCAPETMRKLESGSRRPSKAVAHSLADALK